MLREPFVNKEMIVEVSSSDILQEEVNSVLILKDEVHAQHKGVISLE
jgi:hypothetical protein